MAKKIKKYLFLKIISVYNFERRLKKKTAVFLIITTIVHYRKIHLIHYDVG